MTEPRDESGLDEQGERDTEIRRETNLRDSLGPVVSHEDEKKVTPESDVFKDQPPTKTS